MISFVECVRPKCSDFFIVDYPILSKRPGWVVKQLSDEEFLAVVDIGKSIQARAEASFNRQEFLTLSKSAFADIARRDKK